MDEQIPRRRGRGPTWNKGVIQYAKSRRRAGDSISEIQRALKTEFAQDVPVPESTIKSWVSGIQSDKSGEWTLWRNLPEPDPAIVVAVLASVGWSTGWRVASLTNLQARWITHLSRIRPDLQWNVYDLARQFIEADEAKDEVELRRLQRLVAEDVARTIWPDHEQNVAKVREKAEEISAAIRSGANPFLDGRPYRPEEK